MCQIFAGQDPKDYQPETRRLRLNGQSTSIRLEKSFWEIVDGIAQNEGLTTPAFVSKLHSEVLELRGEAPNLTRSQTLKNIPKHFPPTSPTTTPRVTGS